MSFFQPLASWVLVELDLQKQNRPPRPSEAHLANYGGDACYLCLLPSTEKKMHQHIVFLLVHKCFLNRPNKYIHY